MYIISGVFYKYSGINSGLFIKNGDIITLFNNIYKLYDFIWD